MTDKFNNWFSKIIESIASEEVPTATDAPSGETTKATTSDTVGRKGIMSDVDAIMTSLDALTVELTEDLNQEEPILEGAADAVVDFLIKIPRARKAQAKVNKVKLKSAGLEAAAANSQGDKKVELNKKIELIKTQGKELQSMVDDKFSKSSDIVQSAQSAEKIKGQIAVLKAGMGEGDNSDMKDQAKKLVNRLRDEEAAIAEAQPEKEELEAAKADKEDDKKEEPSVDKEDDKKEDEEPTKNSKEGKLKRLEDLLSKAKESGDDAKIKKVQDLLDKVSAKESWQISNTPLGMMLESEIVKLEMSFTLNESRHQNFDIKNRFSSLL
jgi:hypothetical protein